MTYLIAVLVSVALLVGFSILTFFESRNSVRLFRAPRERFDAAVAHTEFIVTHIDLLAFVRETFRQGMNRTGHVLAHFSLQAVRAIERVLTRLVRHFRTHPDVPVVPRESSREFVKTLSDFKDNLKTTHPDSEIHEVE